MRRVRSVSEIERAVSSSIRSGARMRPATTQASAEAISSTEISTSVASRTASLHLVALAAQRGGDDEHAALAPSPLSSTGTAR